MNDNMPIIKKDIPLDSATLLKDDDEVRLSQIYKKVLDLKKLDPEELAEIVKHHEAQTLSKTYESILVKSELGLEELAQISRIWEVAEDNEYLQKLLEFIDFTTSHTLHSSDSLAYDRSKRAELSEHLLYRMEAKTGIPYGAELKGRSSMLLLVLCPNAAGSSKLSLSDYLNRLGNRGKCPRCKQKYEDHDVRAQHSLISPNEKETNDFTDL